MLVSTNTVLKAKSRAKLKLIQHPRYALVPPLQNDATST